MLKRIVRVTKLGLSQNGDALRNQMPEVWYQPQSVRGMFYITEDIVQLNFEIDFYLGPQLIRVETTNNIYVLVEEK